VAVVPPDRPHDAGQVVRRLFRRDLPKISSV
jgi:hypothetical protein